MKKVFEKNISNILLSIKLSVKKADLQIKNILIGNNENLKSFNSSFWVPTIEWKHTKYATIKIHDQIKEFTEFVVIKISEMGKIKINDEFSKHPQKTFKKKPTISQFATGR